MLFNRYAHSASLLLEDWRIAGLVDWKSLEDWKGFEGLGAHFRRPWELVEVFFESSLVSFDGSWGDFVSHWDALGVP